MYNLYNATLDVKRVPNNVIRGIPAIMLYKNTGDTHNGWDGGCVAVSVSYKWGDGHLEPVDCGTLVLNKNGNNMPDVKNAYVYYSDGSIVECTGSDITAGGLTASFNLSASVKYVWFKTTNPTAAGDYSHDLSINTTTIFPSYTGIAGKSITGNYTYNGNISGLPNSISFSNMYDSTSALTGDELHDTLMYEFETTATGGCTAFKPMYGFTIVPYEGSGGDVSREDVNTRADIIECKTKTSGGDAVWMDYDMRGGNITSFTEGTKVKVKYRIVNDGDEPYVGYNVKPKLKMVLQSPWDDLWKLEASYDNSSDKVHPIPVDWLPRGNEADHVFVNGIGDDLKPYSTSYVNGSITPSRDNVKNIYYDYEMSVYKYNPYEFFKYEKMDDIGSYHDVGAATTFATGNTYFMLLKRTIRRVFGENELVLNVYPGVYVACKSSTDVGYYIAPKFMHAGNGVYNVNNPSEDVSVSVMRMPGIASELNSGFGIFLMKKKTNGSADFIVVDGGDLNKNTTEVTTDNRYVDVLMDMSNLDSDEGGNYKIVYVVNNNVVDAGIGMTSKRFTDNGGVIYIENVVNNLYKAIKIYVDPIEVAPINASLVVSPSESNTALIEDNYDISVVCNASAKYSGTQKGLSYTNDYTASLLRGDNVLWNAYEGVCPGNSKFNISLFGTIDEKEENGVLYGSVDNQVEISDDIMYQYNLCIENVDRNVVYGKATASGKSGKMRAIGGINVFAKQIVLNVGEKLVVVNSTNDKRNVFSTFDYYIDSDHFKYDVSSDLDEIEFPAFSTEGVFEIKVKGHLKPEWQISGKTEIDADVKFLFVSVKRDIYDPSVTRVLDGHKMDFPYKKRDVLFPPNEWITSETMNLRLSRMSDDLEYLLDQATLYEKSPNRFIGYFGNYIASDGTDRFFGFIQDDSVECSDTGSRLVLDDNTVLKSCNAIAADDHSCVYAVGDNCVNILQHTYEYGKLFTIYPEKINDILATTDSVAVSNKTKRIYTLSKKVHKIYIYDAFNHQDKYNVKNCMYYNTIGGYGGESAKYKFNSPADMYIGSGFGEEEERLVVCDSGNSCVKVYTPGGMWINTIDVSATGLNIYGVCIDYFGNINVLSDQYVVVYDVEGNLKNIFELDDKYGHPINIRPQVNAGFVYVLYNDHVAKYNREGQLECKFAVKDKPTYFAMCTDIYDNIYLSTDRSIVQYNDSLGIIYLAEVENARRNMWDFDSIKIHKNEYIQDAVVNTSLQRLYDNIVIGIRSIHSMVVKVMADQRVNRIDDIDSSVYNDIVALDNKDRIFVGVNELVTMDVMNRPLEYMFDILQKVLDII